jgi:hypothetical protein
MNQKKRWKDKHPEYAREYRNKAKNNFYLYFNRKYSGMLERCKGKAGRLQYKGLPILSRNEWNKFLSESRSYLEPWFNHWRATGSEFRSAPTIDRIDSSKGYLIGNIRWLPQSENSIREHRKLTAEQHDIIRRSYRYRTVPIRVFAERFEVHPNTIRRHLGLK